MRRGIRLGLLGLAVYVAALVVQLPAAWLVHWSGDAIPDQVALSGIDGTVWHPRVARIQVDLPGPGALRAGPAEARLHPLGLLTGQLEADLQARGLGGSARARVAMGWGGQWRVTSARADMALESLADVDPRLAFGQRGRVTVEADGLHGVRLPEAGNVRAVIADFQMPGFGPEGPFGTYVADGRFSEGGSLEADVSTEQARVLAVKGTFRADMGSGRARFNGEAWAPDGAPDAARQLLSLFRSYRDGRARINWQGRLR
jgi:hypothetical protein